MKRGPGVHAEEVGDAVVDAGRHAERRRQVESPAHTPQTPTDISHGLRFQTSHMLLSYQSAMYGNSIPAKQLSMLWAWKADMLWLSQHISELGPPHRRIFSRAWQVKGAAKLRP